MSEIQNKNFNILGLSETGFNIINIAMLAVFVIGILVVLLFFRKNINGRKLMFFGGELILLGLIFNIVDDYKVRYPALAFLTILVGLIVSIIGLCIKDKVD